MSSQNSTFMFYGFTVAWLIIIVYVISIALREKKLRQELDRVKRMVEEGEGTPPLADQIQHGDFGPAVHAHASMLPTPLVT